MAVVRVSDLLTDAGKTAIVEIQRKLDKDLYGAWRAGYDYLHVYDPMDPLAGHPDRTSLSLKRYTLPSNSEHAPGIDRASRIQTFDLTDVPTERLKEAWANR